MDSLQQVVRELENSSQVAILSHILPDGDCIGSMLALGRALEIMGKEVIMVNHDPIPEYLAFLPGADKIVFPGQIQHWPSLVICVDCSDPGRLGEEVFAKLRLCRVVNIDHHVSNTQFGSINYVDSEAAATGEIIAEIITQAEVPWDKELATFIYSALVTDTGSFQYSNTTAKVHLLAAQLITVGIDIYAINRHLYETRSPVAVKLLGQALSSLQFTEDGKIAWIALEKADMDKMGARDEHTEGIIGFTRAIKGVEVGILFREIAPGQIKVGFRSKRFVNVDELAGSFGGGGHKRASGCLVQGALSEVVSRVINKTQEFVAR